MSLAAFHTIFIAVGVMIFLPLVGRFGRLIERALPDRGPTLTRHLDKTVLHAPSAALDGFSSRPRRDLRRDLSLTRRFLRKPDPRPDLGGFPTPQLHEALHRIQEFLPQIPSLAADEPLSELRLRQMHAIDHLERLQSKLDFASGSARWSKV